MAKNERSVAPHAEVAPQPNSEVFFNLSRAELADHALRYQVPVFDHEKKQVFQENGEPKTKPQTIRTNRREIVDGKETFVRGPLLFTPEINSRSTSAKHYVQTENTSGELWEKINRPMTENQFAQLHEDIQSHLNKEHKYVIDVALGADTDPEDEAKGRSTRQKVRFVTNSPVHALFASLLYRDLTPEEIEETKKDDYRPDLTINHSPDFKATPEEHGTVGKEVVAFDYDNKEIIIGGTDYLGEIKKAGFTWMHYIVEKLNQEHMNSDETFKAFVTHASAVQKKDGTVAVLFGGSGAGKSSAPPEVTPEKMSEGYMVLYDDEGIVVINGEPTTDIKVGETTSKSIQIEGGAYITVSNAHNEPNVMKLLEREDTLIESVSIDPETKEPNYKYTKRTTNIRAAAKISPETFPTFKESGVSGPVKDMLFLVPDTRGILPPVAKFRNKYQTLLYALVGPGSKIPGREQGVDLIQENFAPLQDEPFLPFHPARSIDSLLAIMEANDTDGWIVSSGWTGGPVGVSERMKVTDTQAAVEDVLDGVMASTDEKDWGIDPIFGWKVHKKYIDANMWEDQEAYEKSRIEYAQAIINFVEKTYPFESHPEMAALYAELPKLPKATEYEVFNAATHTS